MTNKEYTIEENFMMRYQQWLIRSFRYDTPQKLYESRFEKPNHFIFSKCSDNHRHRSIKVVSIY